MSRGSRRPRGSLGALLILGVFAFAAWWTVTTLFATELRQTGHWLQAKVGAIRAM